MTFKKFLFYSLCLLAIAAGLFLAIFRNSNQWRSEPGITLEFQFDNLKVDNDVLPAVEKRLQVAGIWHAIAKHPAPGRITVWIPYPESMQKADEQYKAAREEFRKTEFTQGRIDALMQLPPADRTAEIHRIAPAGSNLHDVLPKLADAYDAHQAARRPLSTIPAASAPADLLQKDRDTARQLNAATAEFFSQNLSLSKLQGILNAADSGVGGEAGSAAAKDARDSLIIHYPSQATEILHVIAAHNARQPIADQHIASPDDIDLILSSTGIVDFRVALAPYEIGGEPLREAIDSLNAHGPKVVLHSAIGDLRWFEINITGIDMLTRSGGAAFVISKSVDATPYLLCYDDHDHSLTHSDPTRKPWSLSARNPYEDPAAGGIVLPFSLDPIGASYMADLTNLNKKHPMAILFDDRVLSAPTIQSQISDAGIITFGTSPTAAPQAQTLARLLRAPLPTPLKRTK